VGLAAVRRPGRPAARRDHVAARAVDDPGDSARRRPRRGAPRQVSGARPRSRHPPFRIIPNGRGRLPSPTRTPRTWSMRHPAHSLVLDVTSSTFGAARTGSGSGPGATPSAGRARGGAWRRSSRARRR
jgi:hypothetical protein